MDRETREGNGRRVAITGMGPITALGIGRDALSAGLRRFESPVTEITRFDATPFRTRIAAQVHDFDPDDFMDTSRSRRLDLFSQFSVAATHLALQDAALDPDDVDGTRVTVQMGSALGGLAHAQQEMIHYIERGVKAVDPRVATTVFCGAASCQVAIEFGFHGPNSTNAMSCASGTMGVGEAFRHIRDGAADVAVAGGIEAPLAPLSYGAFAIIRAMSQRNDDPTHACRPFDADRDGFVMGEGACVLVMEEEGHARARGAHIYGFVDGYAVTNDGHHMAAPLPNGSQAAAAMKGALDSAGIGPGDIDHVNAHASSTPLNDDTESRAIRLALGDHADAVSVTGTKPYHGHALGASGAIEIAAALLSMRDGWIPPILNLEEPGEGCDLDYVTGRGRDQEVRTILTNSFGFGGINACLVLSAPK